MPLVCKDFISENTTCERCGFQSKCSCGLKVHSRNKHRISQNDGADNLLEESQSIGTQTEETCDRRYIIEPPVENSQKSVSRKTSNVVLMESSTYQLCS